MLVFVEPLSALFKSLETVIALFRFITREWTQKLPRNVL
jgi:hypothetical protein